MIAVLTSRDSEAGWGDRLQVWDVASGSVVVASVEAAQCLTVGDSADGPVVVTGHADGAVRVWTASDLTLCHEWYVGKRGIDEIGLGEAVVVTLDGEGAVARCSLQSGESLDALDVTAVRVLCVGELASGRSVIATGGRGLSLWDAINGKRLPLPIPAQESLGKIAALLLCTIAGRDALTVVTGAREIVTFDVLTGAQVGGRIDAHVDDFTEQRGRVWGGRRGRPKLAVVGGMLAVPTRWRVHVWDLSNTTPARPPLPGPVRRPVLATVRWQGRAWLVTGSAEDGVVGLWDINQPVRPLLPGHDEEVALIGLAEPGVVVSVDGGGTIAARRTGDGSLVAEPTESRVPGAVALAAWVAGESVRVAVGAGSPGSSHPWLRRWDLIARAEISPPIKVRVPQLRHVSLATVLGERVLVIIDRDLLQVRRTVDGTLLHEVRKHRGTFRLITGSWEGRPIAVVSALDRVPEIFQLEDLAVPPSPIEGLRGCFAAAVAGQRLLAGSLAERQSGWRTVWACDLSGEPIGPDLHGAPITSVAVAGWPAVYVARSDCTVSLTDFESGRDFCPALHLPAAARSIAVDSNGDLLVGVGADVARFAPPAQLPSG
ncbi:WD40 repeat domain-containing protein [Solwaraspora sp. WMMD1047]|uniref:WD40 repeat domain-containing protein n=1 Tax=Solwaraspora sp. WMMD1047 TaxID=3016102 RepID=UPI002416B26A|nr:WD40 repeat domain-containing protein [Solwaraspora sp. WMMD1047]MDG4832085.1 WD40 repeat domain-containing protein [Solwaraspora sp. WMMD1047]